MAATPDPDDRAKLREFLEQRFSLEELETLAFDFGIDHNKLPHTTIGQLSRELIAYCERRGNLNSLMAKVLRQRPDDDLARLSAKLPVGSPRTKVQIIIAQDVLEDPNEIIADLAAKLKIDIDQVELIGTAPGSLRLLVSLPQDAANVLIRLEVHDLVNGKYRVISITAFDSLDMKRQEAWQLQVRDTSKQRKLAELYSRGDLHLRQKEWLDAIRCFREIVDEGVSYRDAAQLLEYARRQEKLESLYTQGTTHLARYEWNKAKEKFQRTLEVDQGYRDTRAKLAEAKKKAQLQAIYDAAMQDAEQEKWDAVARRLKDILKEEPAFADAKTKLQWVEQRERLAKQYQIALKHLQRQQWQSAIELLEQILAEDSDYKDAGEQMAEAKKNTSRGGQPESKPEGRREQAMLPSALTFLQMVVGILAMVVTISAVGKMNFWQLVFVIIGIVLSSLGLFLIIRFSEGDRRKLGWGAIIVGFMMSVGVSLIGLIIGMVSIQHLPKLEITGVSLGERKVVGKMLVDDWPQRGVAVEVYMRTKGDKGWLLVNPNTGTCTISLDNTWTVCFGQEVHLEPGENLSFAVLVPVNNISELPGFGGDRISKDFGPLKRDLKAWVVGQDTGWISEVYLIPGTPIPTDTSIATSTQTSTPIGSLVGTPTFSLTLTLTSTATPMVTRPPAPTNMPTYTWTPTATRRPPVHISPTFTSTPTPITPDSPPPEPPCRNWPDC